MKYKGFCNQFNQLTHTEHIIGNSLEIQNMSYEEGLRKDIEIQDIQYISIWGQLKDYDDHPIVGECVRLIRIYEDKACEKLEVVQATVTDESGYYKMDVYGKECERYNILVDCKTVAPDRRQPSQQIVRVPVGLATSKRHCISEHVKFTK